MKRIGMGILIALMGLSFSFSFNKQKDSFNPLCLEPKTFLQGRSQWVSYISFTHEDKYIGWAHDDRVIKFCDANSRKEIKTLDSYYWWVPFTSLSADRELLASIKKERTVEVWNVSSGKKVFMWTSDKGSIRSIALSPDGNTLVAGGTDTRGGSCFIMIWNIKGFMMFWNNYFDDEPETIKTKGCSINSLAFSPDGKLLASADHNAVVTIWNFPLRQEIYVLKGHKRWVNSVVFSPDGKLLVSASSDRTIKIWDVSSGKEITTLRGHKLPVHHATFSPDGKGLASGITNLERRTTIENVGPNEIITWSCEE